MSVKVNLVIEQGADFNQHIELTDENDDLLIVTGYVANASMRKSYQAANSIVIGAVLSNGSLDLSMTANNTSNVSPGRYVWDVKLNKIEEDIVTDVTRLIEGIVTVTPAVTKD
jgi:hypothetical protein